jgi:hypothetical protein
MTETADTEICWMTALELGQRIAAGELSSERIVNAHLARIERLNPILEAYVTVVTDAAIAQARERDRELTAGRSRGPLHGVPYALKDIFATSGIRTTAGSSILADWVPDEDATIVSMLTEAGAVLLGKVNTHEFAFGVTTQNQHGRTKKPLGPGPDRRWLVRRIRRCSRGGALSLLAGQRHGRLDPFARRLHRYRRLEADLRADQPLRSRGAVSERRPRRAYGALGGGPRRRPAGHCRTRSA